MNTLVRVFHKELIMIKDYSIIPIEKMKHYSQSDIEQTYLLFKHINGIKKKKRLYRIILITTTILIGLIIYKLIKG